MQPDAWVAPARYPLTVLHRPDPDEHSVAGLFRHEGRVDGWTWCGMPLLEGELWMPVERREGDAVCWVCEAEGRAAATVQEALP